MKLISFLSIVGLASLTACANVPGEADGADPVDQAGQALAVPPDPYALPTTAVAAACLVNEPDALYTVAPTPPSPSSTYSTWSHSETGTSVPAGRLTCGEHVVEFERTFGLVWNIGFDSVDLRASDYPGMTAADCAAMQFTSWIEGFRPAAARGTEGSWTHLGGLTVPGPNANYHTVWSQRADGDHCQMYLPGSNIHFVIAAGTAPGVTRVRVGSRLDVRHGNASTRGPITTYAQFTAY